jgi:hypothetical protein
MDFKTFRAKVVLKDEEAGEIEAMFSVFDIRDDQDDVVLPSFFEDGQAIPMSAWSHTWGALPPGKGVVKVQEKGAVFDGRFFMDTEQGVQHFRTVKNMGDLQEWSFGFRVLEEEEREYINPETGEPDGVANFLIRGETFEATPTLVGANRETHTIAIKDGKLEMGLRNPLATEVSLAAHGELALEMLDGYLKRVADRKAFREQAGRDLSEANREALREMQAGLMATGERVAELLLAAGADLDPARLRGEFLRWESEYIGVPT